MKVSHFSRGFGLSVYFEILVGFKAVEEEVHFINTFIDVPMTTVPRFIVYISSILSSHSSVLVSTVLWSIPGRNVSTGSYFNGQV